MPLNRFATKASSYEDLSRYEKWSKKTGLFFRGFTCSAASGYATLASGFRL